MSFCEKGKCRLFSETLDDVIFNKIRKTAWKRDRAKKLVRISNSTRKAEKMQGIEFCAGVRDSTEF